MRPKPMSKRGVQEVRCAMIGPHAVTPHGVDDLVDALTDGEFAASDLSPKDVKLAQGF